MLEEDQIISLKKMLHHAWNRGSMKGVVVVCNPQDFHWVLQASLGFRVERIAAIKPGIVYIMQTEDYEKLREEEASYDNRDNSG